MTIVAYNMTYFCYKSGLRCGKWNLIHVSKCEHLMVTKNIPLSSQVTNYAVTLLRKFPLPNVLALYLTKN